MSILEEEGPEEFLSFEERTQVRRYLKYPEEFPTEFGSWMVDYMATNGLIPQSTVSGLLKAQRTADEALETAQAGQAAALAAVAAATTAALEDIETQTAAALAAITADMMTAFQDAKSAAINAPDGVLTLSDGPIISNLDAGQYIVIGSADTLVSGGGTSLVSALANGLSTGIYAMVSPPVDGLYQTITYAGVTGSLAAASSIRMGYGHQDTGGSSNFRNRRLVVIRMQP